MAVVMLDFSTNSRIPENFLESYWNQLNKCTLGVSATSTLRVDSNPLTLKLSPPRRKCSSENCAVE
eukprot:Awhi_evm1s1225